MYYSLLILDNALHTVLGFLVNQVKLNENEKCSYDLKLYKFCFIFHFNSSNGVFLFELTIALVILVHHVKLNERITFNI